MTRRTSRRSRQRNVLLTRAPRKGTLVISLLLYAAGILGWRGVVPELAPHATLALAIAGGLLILGALLRDL